MGLASMKVVGNSLEVEASSLGLDEIPADTDVRLDFQSWRQTARCDGYLVRLRTWEERNGKVVVPYAL